MSNENHIARSNGQDMDDSWTNLIRRILLGDLYPRNSSGIVTHEAGSLGSSSYRFLTAYLMSLNFLGGSKSISLEPPTGLALDLTLTPPSSLPTRLLSLFMSNAGVMSTALLSRSYRDSTSLANIIQTTSSGRYTELSSSFADVTNQSVSFTSTGRPVHIALKGLEGAGIGSFGGEGFFELSNIGSIRVLRGATEIYRFTVSSAASNYQYYPLRNGECRDEVSAGTYTYKLQVKDDSGGGGVGISDVVMEVYEAP